MRESVDRPSFATNLQRLFTWHDLTGQEVARMLGASEHSISGWLRGKREPSAKYLVKLGQLFDINPVELFDDPDDFGARISDAERRERADWRLMSAMTAGSRRQPT